MGTMGQVTELQYFPLYEAEGLNSGNTMEIGPTGPVQDNIYAVVDPQNNNEIVGRDEWTGLYGVHLTSRGGNYYRVKWPGSRRTPIRETSLPDDFIYQDHATSELAVTDHGDVIPIPCRALDEDDPTFRWHSEWGRYRLVEIPQAWRTGEGDVLPPDQRQDGRAAPLRIVFTDSIEALNEANIPEIKKTVFNQYPALTHANYDLFITPDRFRAHMAVADLDAFAELQALTEADRTVLRIGNLVVDRLRLAPLGEYPDYQPSDRRFRNINGASIGDVTRNAGLMGRTHDGQPGFVVLGHPRVEIGETVRVNKHDLVHFDRDPNA